MTATKNTGSAPVEMIDSSFMLKIFYCFLAMAGLSLLISFAGKQLGQSIVMAGHTADQSIHEIVIGNNVLVVPANEIRFEGGRRSGVTGRLDTYLTWPAMSGYTADKRGDFDHANGSRNILFISFGERLMSRDMSGRMEPIYNALIDNKGRPGPAGTTVYDFKEKTGYLNEVLVVAKNGRNGLFVARCLSGQVAQNSLAPCERDIHLGDNLSMSFRFPQRLLANWQMLETNMRVYAAKRLKTGR